MPDVGPSVVLYGYAGPIRDRTACAPRCRCYQTHQGSLARPANAVLMYVPVAGCEGANADHSGAAVKIGPVWHTHRARE